MDGKYGVTNRINSKKRKKGLEGEIRVAKAIAQKGYKVIFVGGAVKYSLDGTRFFCADLLPFGKRNTFWVQVKNKEPRIKYPDTGLELWRFKKLQELRKKSGRPVLLLFTDSSKKIYGDWIDNLVIDIQKHKSNWNSKDNCQMIYFWLKDLKSLDILLEKRVKSKQLELPLK